MKLDRSTFITLFANDSMRAHLNWNLIAQDSAFKTVEARYTSSKEVLARFYTVWYVRADGGNGDWRNPADRPLRVVDVVDAESMPAERLRRIEAFRRIFAGHSTPVHLILPAYYVGSCEYLLLDGTHRAAAAYLDDVDIRLHIFALHGPLNPDVLPDLAHF